jgi:ATP-dependent exoDNAse (exonuclease V) beta subunit
MATIKTNKIDVFSKNSLEILEKNVEDFKNRFESGLYFQDKTESALEGSVLHRLIFYYLKGFDIKKIEAALGAHEKQIWENFKKSGILENNFIMFEKSFLTKCTLEGQTFFLTGRLDAVRKKDGQYTIMDWKLKNLPKNPEDDLQSVIYLYSTSKLLNTKNLQMQYCTFEGLKTATVPYLGDEVYEDRIFKIVKPYILSML